MQQMRMKMAYTAEVAQDDSNALDTLCMEGSGDDLGMKDVGIVENPYYNHVPEFEEFEELQGIQVTAEINDTIYNNILVDQKVKAEIQNSSSLQVLVDLVQTWKQSSL